MKRFSSTSLLCGTVLIVVPIVHNLLTVAMVAWLIASRPEKDVHLSGSLSDSYQYWCLFFGACLLVTGIVIAIRSSDQSEARLPDHVSGERSV